MKVFKLYYQNACYCVINYIFLHRKFKTDTKYKYNMASVVGPSY